MNKTLAYIGLKYHNPGLAYLALFALTPHPYNKDAVYVDPQTGQRVHTSNLRNARSASNRQGKHITDSDVLRKPGQKQRLCVT